MHSREEVTLARDVEAIQIPDGIPAVLTEGSRVMITQELGGSFTVMTDIGMFRIEEKNADVLGKELGTTGKDQLPDDAPLLDRVWAQLKQCYDPEIPVNIVDLGLVYDCSVLDGPDDGSKVQVKMTLTAPGCGMGPVLADDVKRRVESLPGVSESDVEIVFDPPWGPNMMTEAAKLQLGLM